MEKEYLKSAVKLFLKLNLIASISGLSNQILCIFIAQETAKLPNDKVGGLKKILPVGPIRTMHVRPGFKSRYFCISNCDLWYLCSPLSYKDAWYLI